MDIYKSRDVQVSVPRVTIGGTDYPVRNISAVKVETDTPSSGAPVFLLILGLCLAIGGGATIYEGGDDGMTMMGIVILMGGLALTGAAVYILSSSRPTYNLTFQTNAGAVTAYTTNDKEQIGSIRKAINQAIDAQSSS